MKKIIYSAPAKVILSGEHAVVYGRPALVSAIDLRLNFSLWKKQNSNNHLGNGRDLDGNIKYIANLTRNFLEKKKTLITRDSHYQYRINSDIPIGRGLGSSAALSVAATAAFLEFFSGEKFDHEAINSLAYEAEKKFHKNPSGVDNTASCLAGLIYFRKEFEFLKNICQLSLQIPPKIERCLYLIDSGKPKETTAQMVAYVNSLYKKKPKLVEEILTEIEKTTKTMVTAFFEEDKKLLVESIKDNQSLLEKLDVVSLKTKKFLTNLSQFGVGKITGAGGKKYGSGFLLFYTKDPAGFKLFCAENNIRYFKFKQSARGLIKCHFN